MLLNGKRILITGGTGSLGQALIRRLLTGEVGTPKSITVFSRDEAKQHQMRQDYPNKLLHYIIGDIRDYRSVQEALQSTDILFHTAALKRVETCEEHPAQAVFTNIDGALNIVAAIREGHTDIQTVVGVSSDKGRNPVNVYGATKFIQEQILLRANIDCPNTRFVSVCYGNVMASRGSVIPKWQEQIRQGGPVRITHPAMTRFLISLDRAVDTLLAVLENGQRGEIYVPIIPSAYIDDIADVLINGRLIDRIIIGKGPGEKLHEVLITPEEAERTVRRGDYYVVTPHFQEKPAIVGEYCSDSHLIGKDELRELFIKHGLIEKTKDELRELKRLLLR